MPQEPGESARVEPPPNALELALFALLGVLLVAVYGFAARWTGPAEDAAILYSYSENLAHSGAISFYPGGPPAEGGTDFLWLVALAGCVRLGLDAHVAATLFSALAHVGIAWTLTRLAGRPDRRLFLALAFALFLVPATCAAVLGFAPLVFGCFVLLEVRWLVERRATALAWTGLVTCLIRPDGVVFTLPLFAAFLWLEREQRAHALRRFALCFALPGLAYFVWRLWYFEHWLPLPFYVKSGSRSFLGLFEKQALLLNLRYLLLFAPLFVLAARHLRAGAERARVLVLAGALVLVPLLFYGTFQLTQNVGERFQYPLALGALALPLVRREAPPRRGAYLACLGASLTLTLPFFLLQVLFTALIPLQTAPALARDLAPLECGRAMAVTEAGRLPYYSRWKALDLWGLNTPEFARRPPTAADLAPHALDLLALHAVPSVYKKLVQGGAELAELHEHDWTAMVQNSYAYAVGAGYELWMVPYVRPAAREEPFATLVPLAARLNAELDLSERYEMFLIAPRSACRDELRRVLQAHGALTLADYARRMRGG